ncbi:MAG: hypothetical protein M3Q97_10935, partial [Bacteroidota bacterium]|nr:hypothetical protein [Bacteroidota bacterium]
VVAAVAEAAAATAVAAMATTNVGKLKNADFFIIRKKRAEMPAFFVPDFSLSGHTGLSFFIFITNFVRISLHNRHRN